MICQLSDLVSGDKCFVENINSDMPKAIYQRFLDMGIVRGEEITIKRHAPLKDPVEIFVKGSHVALRISEAANIQVKRIESVDK